MNKKHEAQQLYMNGCRTQKEIAEIVGVSERTVHTWIHQYTWDKLRLAAYHAPATIVDNLCSQIVELQNAIARKEPGARYANPQEAEIMRKLIVCMEKMKKTPSLAQSMQMLETFRNYVRPLDKDFTKKLSTYTNKFLNAKATNGYAPYQAEYGVEPVPPLTHIYDEVPQEEENGNIPQSAEENSPAVISSNGSLSNGIPLGAPNYQACPDINTCLHQGDCTYPKCLHPERYVPAIDPVTLYRTTPILSGYYNELVDVEPFDGELVEPPQNKSVESLNPSNLPADRQGSRFNQTETTGNVPAMFKEETTHENQGLDNVIGYDITPVSQSGCSPMDHVTSPSPSDYTLPKF